MKIQTLSIIVGGTACNAQCPFCVSRMTGKMGLKNPKKQQEPNWANFDKAVHFAQNSGVSTVMLTGKGEPTLWPHLIYKYLNRLSCTHNPTRVSAFPFVEMQTNATLLDLNKTIKIIGEDVEQTWEDALTSWHRLGLNTIAISVAHWDRKYNAKIYGGKHFDLSKKIEDLHGLGFSIRLNCVLTKDGVNQADDYLQMVNFCKINKVEQLTFTPVTKPIKRKNNLGIYDWTTENHASMDEFNMFFKTLEDKGTRLIELPHGAVIFDYDGQNVCMSNCLVQETYKSYMRNLIFFPDGKLRFRWDAEGSVLL